MGFHAFMIQQRSIGLIGNGQNAFVGPFQCVDIFGLVSGFFDLSFSRHVCLINDVFSDTTSAGAVTSKVYVATSKAYEENFGATGIHTL